MLGASVCIAGLSVMVTSDWIAGRNGSSPAPDPVRGDLLCIAGAFFYAATNVGQEALVKRFDKVSWLGKGALQPLYPALARRPRRPSTWAWWGHLAPSCLAPKSLLSRLTSCRP